MSKLNLEIEEKDEKIFIKTKDIIPANTVLAIFSKQQEGSCELFIKRLKNETNK